MVASCAVCGGSVEVFSETLPEPEGPPDFDTRPSEPLRSTLTQWVHMCLHCGYASEDLTLTHSETRSIVESDPYRQIVEDDTYPPASRPFLCYAHLLARLHQAADAGWSCLHAAWVCDDLDKVAAAASCRARAIEVWQKGKLAGQSFGDDLVSEFALVTDLYRRMGQFEDATVACAEALDMDDLSPLMERLLRKQMTLIQARDTGLHNLSELLVR